MNAPATTSPCWCARSVKAARGIAVVVIPRRERLVADIAETVDLPVGPTGFLTTYDVTDDGRLIVVRCDFTGSLGRLGHLAQGQFNARVSLFEGAREIETIEVRTWPRPLADRFADGRWIIASRPPDDLAYEAHVYSQDGAMLTVFTLGEGVASLQCAPDGSVWVGYFDEGCFASNNDDGSRANSTGGLVQYSPLGSVLWSFNQFLETDAAAENDSWRRQIADCYAMTVENENVWTCSYSSFLIARITNRAVRFWRNEVHAAVAIAATGKSVILAGGLRGETAEHMVLLELEGDDAVARGKLRLPVPSDRGPRLARGRGSTLHLIYDKLWTRVTVEAARAALISSEC